MIHMVQCLCGPARHAIFGIMYDDGGGVVTAKEAMAALKEYVEHLIESKQIRRRCEICDKNVGEFWYEDHIPKEQNWDKAVAWGKQSEAEQMLTREVIQATRKAEKN